MFIKSEFQTGTTLLVRHWHRPPVTTGAVLSSPESTLAGVGSVFGGELICRTCLAELKMRVSIARSHHTGSEFQQFSGKAWLSPRARKACY